MKTYRFRGTDQELEDLQYYCKIEEEKMEKSTSREVQKFNKRTENERNILINLTLEIMHADRYSDQHLNGYYDDPNPAKNLNHPCQCSLKYKQILVWQCN